MDSTPSLKDRWPASLSGAGLLLFLSLSLGGGMLAGCEAGPDPVPDAEEEAARAVGLGEGARLHRVILGGRGSEEHILPGRVQAAPGDGVEFVTVDHRVHTLTFLTDSLSQEGAEFLESAIPSPPPPLLHRGSRYLLLLVDAPPGRYLFVSEGHGGVARGVIDVGSPSDSLAPGPPGGQVQ